MRHWPRKGLSFEAEPAEAGDAGAAEDAVPEPGPELELGFLPCSGRGCREQTGIACAYVDRRERCCPTAWCPTHRLVHQRQVVCPVHGVILGASEDALTEHHRADLGNVVPLLVCWVARELEAPVGALMAEVAERYGQTLVVDPVRFVLVGVERVRTWERAWKICAPVGVSLRVHLAVEEAAPEVVLGKFNSKVAVTVPAPSPEICERAEDPAHPQLREVAEFRDRVVRAISSAVSAWQAVNPPPPAPRPEPAAGPDAAVAEGHAPAA
jgi:hypothetical protein